MELPLLGIARQPASECKAKAGCRADNKKPAPMHVCGDVHSAPSLPNFCNRECLLESEAHSLYFSDRRLLSIRCLFPRSGCLPLTAVCLSLSDQPSSARNCHGLTHSTAQQWQNIKQLIPARAISHYAAVFVCLGQPWPGQERRQ